jgi:hypothetical protein
VTIIAQCSEMGQAIRTGLVIADEPDADWSRPPPARRASVAVKTRARRRSNSLKPQDNPAVSRSRQAGMRRGNHRAWRNVIAH